MSDSNRNFFIESFQKSAYQSYGVPPQSTAMKTYAGNTYQLQKIAPSSYNQSEDEPQKIELPFTLKREKPPNKITTIIDFSNDQELLNYTPQSQKKGQKGHTYDPLAIPADWNLAAQHALARRVAKEKDDDPNQITCPCCGYEVNRKRIKLCNGVIELNFLGSGLPLFYNFIVYCSFILFLQFTIKGAFDLYVNLTGTYCLTIDPDQPANLQCPLTWMSILSLANSYNQTDLISVRAYLDILMVVLIMITLALFRQSQKQLEVDIDISFNSPSDYTIMITNIPIGLKIDYKNELTKSLENCVKDQQLVVTKVVLVHQIGEIVTLEKQLDALVAEKKEFLFKSNMNFQHKNVQVFNQRIRELQELIYKKEIELERDDSKFEGIAFVSFLTEEMKRKVILTNPYTFWDLFRAYQMDGYYTDQTLSWNGKKLFIKEAPEPNGIDWSNIHAKTKDRIYGSIKSLIYSAIFMIIIFFILWGVSIWKGNILAQVKAAIANGTSNSASMQFKATVMTSMVSWVIVLFNKFLIGPAIKTFVLMEKIETKTQFNISMAKKVTVALFINTALLVYVIEIIISDNIIGNGGFIQAETAVFVSNAWFTIAVWVIDPWYIDKVYQRNKILHSQDPQPVTQQEANLLMEDTDYSQSKRYCDIMKTMWFTFFYGDAIPIGIPINILQLFIYYWIDKYNVLRRRTIKDTISSDLSNEMITWLTFILVLHAIGEISMTYGIYKFVPWQHYFVLVISLLYMILPIEEWTFKLFPINEHDETEDYDKVWWKFDTDYDRENPITRTFALKRWQIFHDQMTKNPSQHHPEQTQGYKHQFGTL